MYISFPSGTSFTYGSLSARSTSADVTISGDAESTAPRRVPKLNVGGALNALEHSSSMNVRPLLTRGSLQRLTGLKVRGLDIDSLQVSQSSASLDAASLAQTSGDDGEGVTVDALSANVQCTSFDLQGTVQTKSGDDVSLSVQLSSSRISACYAALTSETGGETTDIDTAA